jgi:hypothetical protein
MGNFIPLVGSLFALVFLSFLFSFCLNDFFMAYLQHGQSISSA